MPRPLTPVCIPTPAFVGRVVDLTCDACDGAGQIQRVQYGERWDRCDACEGEGFTGPALCRECHTPVTFGDALEGVETREDVHTGATVREAFFVHEACAVASDRRVA